MQDSELSQLLLTDVRMRMVCHCFLILNTVNKWQFFSLVHLPRAGYGNLGDSPPLSPTLDISYRLFQLHDNIRNLRILADDLPRHSRANSESASLVQLLARCHETDTALVSWSQSVPESWKYNSMQVPPNLHPHYNIFQTYPGRIDTYSDVAVAREWNFYRSARILVQTIVLGCLTQVIENSEFDPSAKAAMAAESAAATTIMHDMVNEICASVPYHLGCALPINDYLSPNHSRSNEPNPHPLLPILSPQKSPNTAPDNRGLFFVLWPLLVAQATHTTPAPQAQWIKGLIFDVARRVGLEEAVVDDRIRRGIGWDMSRRRGG